LHRCSSDYIDILKDAPDLRHADVVAWGPR
jgi:hypothetical protein